VKESRIQAAKHITALKNTLTKIELYQSAQKNHKIDSGSLKLPVKIASGVKIHFE